MIKYEITEQQANVLLKTLLEYPAKEVIPAIDILRSLVKLIPQKEKGADDAEETAEKTK